MKIAEAKKLIEEFKGEDIIVRTPDQEQEFLANFRNEVVEKDVKPVAGQIHSRYEQDIAEITGQKKPDGKKAYDWMKDVLRTAWEQGKQLEPIRQQLAETEKKLKDGKVDEVLKAKVEELGKEVTRLEKINKDNSDKHKAELDKEKKANMEVRKRTDLTYALTGMKFLPKEIVAEDVRKIFIEKVIADLIPVADYDESGAMFFRDAEGNKMRSSDSAVITSVQLLSQRLASVLDRGKSQTGTGGNGSPERTEYTGETIPLPDTIKTQAELTRHLRGLGIASNDARYIATFKKAVADKMPIQ